MANQNRTGGQAEGGRGTMNPNQSSGRGVNTQSTTGAGETSKSNSSYGTNRSSASQGSSQGMNQNKQSRNIDK